jgi:CRISPR system Cascade subunit CasB
MKRREGLNTEKNKQFVEYVIRMVKSGSGKGFAAKLKKADNDSTEYQSWEILARWVDLRFEKDRRSYGFIGASIARTKPESDGKLSLGEALYAVYKLRGNSTEPEHSPSAARLKRLLSCRDALELLGVLRSTMRLIETNGIAISYTKLLNAILWFDTDRGRERVRAKWAQDFFGKKEAS